MFAPTFEILGAVDGDVTVVGTFATGVFAFDFTACWGEEVMVFVGVVAETFGGGTDVATSKGVGIVPCTE